MGWFYIFFLLLLPTDEKQVSQDSSILFFFPYYLLFLINTHRGEENTSYIKIKFTSSILGQTITRERKMPAMFK